MEEVTVLLVKPDGVERGLVNVIRKIIEAFHLSITREVERTLSPNDVENIYREIGNISQRDYFPELVNFMSSKPVHIFVLKGENAIQKGREIIGKRDPPSGIRAWWSHDIIRNVAHGPHNAKEAENHLDILFKER